MIAAESLLHLLETIGVGLFTGGVAWGSIKGALRTTNNKLDAHIANSEAWRSSMDNRLNGITTHLYGGR